MEVTILGSGTGAPSLNRGASGLNVKIGNQNFLFDTGPGIIRRLLEIGITYHDIDYIFYTHFHTDHTLDLASFLFAAKYALSLRTKELTVVGPQGLSRFYDSFIDLYGDVIRPEAFRVNLHEIRERELKFEGCRIVAKHMQHTPESLGYRIESGAKVLVYSGDTDVCENIVELGQGADVLILDCSFPDEMKVQGHLVPSEAAKIAQACHCQKLILTHLYPVCQEEEIIRQARKEFRGPFFVASDLMKISI